GGGPETTCGLFEFRAWKISPRGERLWTVDWPTANCASAEPAAFAMGADGSIAMAGQTHNPFNIAVLHVDPSGNWWTRTFSGGTAGGKDIAIDASGNVIVAGATGPFNAADVTTVGWSSAGALIFNRTDPASGPDVVVDLSLDGPARFVI